nr:FecR domain-containing protein [Pseudomonas cyclaminis]
MREAARWLVRLDGEADEAQRADFEAWLKIDPQHVTAIERLERGMFLPHDLPADVARYALKQVFPESCLPKVVKVIALTSLLTLPLGVAWYQFTQKIFLPDFETSNGQWRTETLVDGSQVSLDGQSAINVDFDSRTRSVRLLRGSVLVSVAKDLHRPFQVVTDHATIRALGTRFVVDLDSEGTRLAMIESRTVVKSASQDVEVHAGQQVRFDANGPGELRPVNSRTLEIAWSQHQMLFDHQPLSLVLDQLNRNRAGFIWFDRKALQRIEVNAVLPTDDSDSALRLLARSLPIEIRQFTPWVTRVTLKSGD